MTEEQITAEHVIGEPEVFILVRQIIDGQLMQTVKRVDLFMRSRARVGMADYAIDEGLAEMRHYATSTRPT